MENRLKELVEEHINRIDECLKTDDVSMKQMLLRELIDTWSGKIADIKACKVNVYEGHHAEKYADFSIYDSKLRSLKDKLIIFISE